MATNLSPSGKFCLKIVQSPTPEYEIIRSHDNSHVITRRLELPFRYNFLQDGEREYFMTSRSPHGMTIIDCQTGQVWSYEPEVMHEWYPEWMLVPGSNVLVLNGYIRCGSYVFWKFFDFDLTKFKQGLPQLEEILPNDCYLDDNGSFTLQQGKNISPNILKDVKVESEDYYLVFTRTIDYNMAAKMPQDELLFNPEDWLPLLPQEERSKITDLLTKWQSQDKLRNFALFYEDKKKLMDEFASYLEKDMVKINSQEAVLQRVDDKIVYLVFRNRLDEETGELRE